MTAVRAVINKRPVPNWLLVYGSLIVLAELSIVVLGLAIGALLHGATLIGLAAHNTFARTPKDPQIPTLMVLPLLRLLSLVMPIQAMPAITWYAWVGVPVLAAIFLIMRAIGFDLADIGLRRPRSIRTELLLALFGIPLGLLMGSTAVAALRPLADVSLPMYLLIAVPFIVLLEELLFRGLIQRVAVMRSPNLAIAIPNVIYAAMYIGSGNGIAALMMGGFGVLLSAMTLARGTLWAAIGAHLLMRLVLHLGLAI